VVGVGNADDFRVGDLGLECFGLAFDVAYVSGLHSGAYFRFVFVGVAEVVGVGEDGEDRNTFDGVVALHTFPDGEECGRRSRGMTCRRRRWNGLHVMLLLLEAFLKLLKVGEEIVDELHLFGWRYVGEELIDLIPNRDGVDEEGTVSLVVEGVRVSGVQIDQGSNFLGVAGAYGAELFAGDGVSSEDGASQMEGVDDGEDVIAEAIGFVVGRGGCGGGGGTEAAAGDSVNMVAGGEFDREFIKDVGVVAETGEQDERTACATPI
jgi:hypothetical protein